MRRLTLDETWELCVNGLWKWIDRKLRKDPTLDVFDLKREWANKHEKNGRPLCDCYFCEYAKQNKKIGDVCSCPRCPAYAVDENLRVFSCPRCPAYAVDENLRKLDSRRGKGLLWCESLESSENGYDWRNEPLAFYAKLRELYKIYKAQK